MCKLQGEKIFMTSIRPYTLLCTGKKVSSLDRDSFGPETRDETQNGPESRARDSGTRTALLARTVAIPRAII